MKAIIFSVSVVFLSLTANAQSGDKGVWAKVGSFFDGNVEKPIETCINQKEGQKNHLKIECPMQSPINTLRNIFGAEFQETDFEKVTYEDGSYISAFKGKEYSIYSVWSKDGKLVKFYQGLKGSGCHYEYEVSKNSTGSGRICGPKKGQTVSHECGVKMARDPLNSREGICAPMLEAIETCSKNEGATRKCVNTIYAVKNVVDDQAPKADGYKLQMPVGPTGPNSTSKSSQ